MRWRIRYPLPPDVRAKMAAAVADVPVNRYPDGGAAAVKAALREAFAIPETLRHRPRQRLGRADPDAHGRRGRARRDDHGARAVVRDVPDERRSTPARVSSACRSPRISRSMRRRCWKRSSASSRRSSFSPIPTIRRETSSRRADVEAILRAAPGLVVVDEAYHAFAGDELPAAARANSRTSS